MVVFVVNETFFCQFVLLVSEDVERDGKLISNANVLKALLNNRPNVGHGGGGRRDWVESTSMLFNQVAFNYGSCSN